MHPTRREFLRLGLGSSTLLACAASVPTFLARSAHALSANGGKRGDRILVLLQLDGGNDGLNTVVPYRDPDYAKHRPQLHLADNLHKVDDRIALHASLGGLATLLESRRLAIVQSVGYPNPNRSHFESMAIWHAARFHPQREPSGWLARSMDLRPNVPGGDVSAMHIGDGALPAALAGGQRHVLSLTNPEQFRRRLGTAGGPGAAEQRAALDQLAGRARGKPGSLLEFVERSTLITYASSARLEKALEQKDAGGIRYPEYFGLARRLRLIARLIQAGLTTSIYYTQLGGFDTHANQLGTHAGLLQEMGDSLRAFLDDLEQSGDGGRVVVLVFSEFGRRLAENASGGTDHGTAAPVFLLGRPVRPGLHGPYLNLQHLEGGDPKHAVDFRRIYAGLLDHWLGCPAESVLGERFTPLPVLVS